MSNTESRLKELGITLPTPPAPVASYVPFVTSGNLVFVSGQIPLAADGLKYIGKLGADISLEDGKAAARLCAVNLLAQLKAACGGDLDRVRRVVRLGGFITSAPGFTGQAQVMNGASDLAVAVFGEVGLADLLAAEPAFAKPGRIVQTGAHSPDGSFSAAKMQAIRKFERDYLIQLMRQTDGNISAAARLSGTERRQLGKLLTKHGIGTGQFRAH